MPIYPLRPYQLSAVQAAVNWIKYKNEPAIIVLPTGSGKTIVIKSLIEHYYNLNKRVLLIAHRKELLEQAAEKLSVPFGLYGASLGDKNTSELVTIASVQSLANKEDVEPFELIIIDESHRVSNNQEGQYWDIINRHPDAKLVGLTASPMRLGSGKLNWGEIVYEISYHQLLKADYLSPITNKVTGTPNLDNIQINMGEYSIEQLEAVMSDAGLLLSAVEAIKKHTVNRNSVLIFTVSIKHSNLLKEILAKNDIDAEMICGDTPTETRDRILSDFKNNKIKYLINTEILLEGFDATCIDCIVCLRPTKSFVLHTQMLGRGVRKHEGKDNCLLVDMSGNLQELGALGSPYTEPSKKEAKRSHGKICPSCEEFVPPTTRECPDCAFQFPEPEVSLIKHNADPDFESDVIYNPITEYDVSGVRYCEHTNKKNGNKSIRIDYIVQSQYGKISEWIAPFSESDWARNNCFNFFKKRGHELASPTNTYTMEALLWHCEQMKKPIKIEVIKEGKYDRVSNHYFEEEAKPQITSQELADELGEGDLGDLW